MGWIYEFAIDFGEKQKAVTRFEWLATAISASPLFAELFKLNICSYQLYRKSKRAWFDAKVESHSSSAIEASIDAEIIKEFSHRYPDTGYVYEGCWRVTRYHWQKDLPPEQGKGRTELIVFDKEFEPLLDWDHHPTGITYFAGDYKDYYGGFRDETTTKNIDLLLNELLFLADLGAVSIYGYDADRSPDPRFWSMVYHLHSKDFIEDLRLAGIDVSNLAQLDTEIVIAAVNQCENIGFKRSNQGVLVYHKVGTGGRLQRFYEILQTMLYIN